MDKPERRKRLEELKTERRTMLFHEAPHKLKATLADFSSVFGDDRRISLCRELTKRNEDILRTTVGGAIAFYGQNDPRGEYVLVVEGCTKEDSAAEAFWADMSIPEHVAHYLEAGMNRNDAIKAAAHDRGVSKNEVYQQMIGK